MHPVSKTIIERSPPRIQPAVALVVRTIDDTFEDRVPGLAAEIAFFMLLSLPALLLTVLAAVGYLGRLVGASFQEDFAELIVDVAEPALSAQAVNEVIRPTLDALIVEGRGGVLSVAFILTLIAASRAIKVVLTALSIAYDIPRVRTGFQQRMWGLGLTLAGMIVGPLVLPVFVGGPEFGQAIETWIADHATRIDSVPGLAETWELLYWPLTVVILTAIIASLYHFGAPWKTPWRRDIPGALLAMLVWLVGTAGLRVYIGTTISGEAVYDPLSSTLALLLWLYVIGFGILLGAEFNAEIEKLWPVHGQAPVAPAGNGDEPDEHGSAGEDRGDDRNALPLPEDGP